MRVDLSDRIMIVTGSTQGVGEAIARQAAASGAAGVLVTGRDAEAAERVAADLSGSGTQTATVIADLVEPDAPDRIFAKAVEAFGRVDLLVNAAAVTDRAGWPDATVAEWDRQFAINARAPFVLMQRVIAGLLDRGAEGSIVNILSVNAMCGAPELAVYSATKGALATLTRNAANAHMADGIRVNGINLGWADTPGERRMQAETLGKGEGWLDEARAKMPLGRLITTDEVARMAVFLLSPQAGLLTGTLTDYGQFVTGSV
jgi:NAD(P)-dependent dehydrogenase (short-subunit alcohol dehydrogenase family)